jgi:hypothetical protein
MEVSSAVFRGGACLEKEEEMVHPIHWWWKVANICLGIRLRWQGGFRDGLVLLLLFVVPQGFHFVLSYSV